MCRSQLIREQNFSAKILENGRSAVNWEEFHRDF